MILANEGKTKVLPPPQRNWALFLDIDGTLIDLAPSPELVRTPPELLHILENANKILDGAIAFISGRTLRQIDNILAPQRYPAAGEHGAELRQCDGSIHHPPAAHRFPDTLYREIYHETHSWAGVLVEKKNFGITIHYRQAPHYETQVRALAEASLSKTDIKLELLPASMACELRCPFVNKGAAIDFFMQRPPYRDRIPVFIGDDVTDEDGIRAAKRMNGYGLHVARDFGGQTQSVREWIAGIK